MDVKNFYSKKINTLNVVLCLVLLPAGNAHSEPDSGPLLGAQVEAMLEWAQQHNPELVASRAEAEAMLQRADTAGAWADPSLRAEWMGINNIDNAARSTRYTLMQAVPFWGKRGLRREVAEAETNQAQGVSLETWADLASRIKTDFAQYYLLHRSEKITQEILTLTDNLERVAQARYATGLAAQQDVLRAQIEQTQLQRELLMLETEHHHAITRLNTLLKRPASAPLADPENLRAIPPPSVRESAALAQRLRAKNPQLFAADAKRIAAEKNRELTLKNRYPDLILGVSPVRSGGQTMEWGVMAELNIPLQQGSRRAQERAANAELNAARARQESLATQLQGDLSKQVISLEAAVRLENIIANNLLPQAEATLQAALVGYQNGTVDFATLLDAQRQLLKAKLDVLNAQVEAQISIAQIEKLLGEDL